jgi:cellulose synthase operon protein YhjU
VVMFKALSRWVRVDVVVVVGMVLFGVFKLLPLGGSADAVMPDMNLVLQDFFAKEAQRSVVFDSPQAAEVPFDVIFIHVCSLSWDDVVAVGLDHHPLWTHFDMLLSRFNSAASYSGPAAIHLLRAKCGQTEHGKMYLPTADKCYLMNSLQVSGFEENVVLNHDGKFDDFLGQLKKYGDLNAPPMSLEGLVPAQYAFDKSPVFDDNAVLERWLEARQKSTSARVAMYYNTVSMHDGNHLSGATSTANTLDSYKGRLSRFLDELDGFLQKLDQSGRRAVVVMVPEHGGAVRGDKMQIAGLREIPTPAITIVPVGIRVVGGNLKHGDSPLMIDKPTSYLAISHIVARMLEQSPFDRDRFEASDYIADLPETEFVAQDEKITVAAYKRKFYLSRSPGNWEPYSEFNKPSANR